MFSRERSWCGQAWLSARRPREIELNEGESASVTPQGVVTRLRPSVANRRQCDRLCSQDSQEIIKTLNLVDMVAGGDGFGKARDRGIDPTTGKTTAYSQTQEHRRRLGDGRYHRVEGLPFVDGVFVP